MTARTTPAPSTAGAASVIVGRPRPRSKPYRPSVGLPDSIVRAMSRGSVPTGRVAEGRAAQKTWPSAFTATRSR